MGGKKEKQDGMEDVGAPIEAARVPVGDADQAEASMAEEFEEKGPTKEESLKRAVAAAWGIDPQHIFGIGVDEKNEVLTFVTNGGKKVRWAKGEEPGRLTEIEITGINPENARRKPIAGKQRD